ITVPPSFFSQAPSSFNIEAIEKTSVRAVTHEQLERVLQKEPHLERYFRIIVVEIMIALGQKIVHLLTKSAEERYQEMIEKYPDIFSRANLGHIAGYLGITQQSLSRIRTPRK
ncbi:MAG: Crp/Fnr family transcriptional regulator, partial [Bacteroidota bacterium]